MSRLRFYLKNLYAWGAFVLVALLCAALPCSTVRAQAVIVAEPLDGKDFGNDLQEYVPPPMFLDNVSYVALARPSTAEEKISGADNLIVSASIPDAPEDTPPDIKAIAESDNEIKVFEVTVKEGGIKEPTGTGMASSPKVPVTSLPEKTVKTKKDNFVHQANFSPAKKAPPASAPARPVPSPSKEDALLEQKIVDASVEDILHQIDSSHDGEKDNSVQKPVRYFDGTPVRVASADAKNIMGAKAEKQKPHSVKPLEQTEKLTRIVPDATVERQVLKELASPAAAGGLASSGNTRVEPEAPQFDAGKPITVYFRPETLESEMLVQGAMIQDILLRLGVDASKKHLELVSYTNTQVLSAKEARRISYLRGRALKEMLAQYHIKPEQVSIRALSAHEESVAETDRIEIVFRDVIG